MFMQAKQNRIFEDIVSQIQEAILQRRLKEGDKLPGERTLRETFKVSRGTLREALRALEQKGLIAIKTGVRGGAIVCPVDTRQISESLGFLLQYQKVSLGELAEFREEVEGLVAAKAAQKAKKEDLRQLAGFLEKIKSHLNASELRWGEIVTEDNKFHRSLARIAGNKVFESVLCTIYDNINLYFDQFHPKERVTAEKNYQSLKKIKEAIEKRDSVKAQILVQEHVKRSNLLMEKNRKKKEVQFTSNLPVYSRNKFHY